MSQKTEVNIAISIAIMLPSLSVYCTGKIRFNGYLCQLRGQYLPLQVTKISNIFGFNKGSKMTYSGVVLVSFS